MSSCAARRSRSHARSSTRRSRPSTTRWRWRTSSSTRTVLEEFAESPGAYLAAGEGTEVVDSERYFAAVVAGGRYVNVCRLRFEPEEAVEVMVEVRALAPRGVGAWSTRRQEVAQALVAAGGRAPEPPLEPWCTALATD